MKHILITALLCGMALTTVRAQSSDIQSYVNIQTPTVASFMKNIDHPVGIYHGNPEIAHTIYTLKDGSIELPLTLQYNASGIKVNEEASWVGLGWNLNVGGMVVQSAVGTQDIPLDYTSCCQEYYPTAPFDYYRQILFRGNDKNKYDGFFNNATLGRLQPDVFYFSYPGGSGKFFIDYRDNSIHPFDDSKPIQIETLTNSWRITTESGIRHTFDKRSQLYSDGQQSGYTYYLTSSVYPNGQQVTYNYTFNEVCTYHPSETHVSILQQALPAIPSNSFQHNNRTVTAKSNEGTLTSITTTNYTITFVSSNREDVNNALKLDEIKITPSSNSSAWGNPLKRFKLAYSYFTSNLTAAHWIYGYSEADTDRSGKRLKLLSLCERDAAGNEDAKLSFDYYGPDLPRKNSYAVDYWGYYNGQTYNTSLIPMLKHLLTDKTTLDWVNNTGTALRAHNSNYCVAGMLKRVTYPTKGYMEYSYEPHEFQSSVFIPTMDELNNSSSGMSTQEAESRNTPTDRNSVSVETAAGGQITIDFYIEKGLNTWREMEGCHYLLERCPVGGNTYNTVKEVTFTSFGLETAGNYRTTYSTTSSGGTYRLTISLPAAIGNQVGSTTKHGLFKAKMTAPTPGATSRGYSRGGGLRVNRVTYHDGVSDASDYTLSYSYPDPKNNAVSFVPLVFHRQYNNLKYTQMTYDSYGKPYFVHEGSQGSELEVSGSNLSSAPYSSIGATVGYSSVSEARSGAGSTSYEFSNHNEVNATMSYQIPRPGNGQLLWMGRYDTSGTLVQSEANTYSSSRAHFYYGVSIQDNFNRAPYLYDNLVDRYNLLDFGNYAGRFMTLLYALDSYRNLLTQKSVTQDGVNTLHTYTYDSNCQVTNETVTGSNGKAVATTYSYPYNFSCAPYSTMAGKYMYAYPIEVKTLIDGKLADSRLTRYQAFGSLLLPQSVTRGSFTTPVTNSTTFSCSGTSTSIYPSTDVTFLKYDAYGNPVHIRVKGEDILYIWGYNYQYPVAEIRMSNYDSVKGVLGGALESMSALAVPATSKIDLVRNTLPGALVTTYTYRPLVGITSKTAPNGEVTTYEYDSFGRLTNIKDNDSKTTQQYEYHYKQ